MQHRFSYIDSDLLQKVSGISFPLSFSKKKWEKFLDRPLDEDELELLSDAYLEFDMNNSINKLYEHLEEKNMYIPYLSGLYGNCLFESIINDMDFDSAKELRLHTYDIMTKYKNTKNIFSNQPESPNELFDMFNEVQTVKIDDEVCEYTYDVMCNDIKKNYSWKRLPVQLILMVLSYVHNVEFNIISESCSHVIYTGIDSDNVTSIYLGHIDETHYVPISIISDISDNKKLYYDESLTLFFEWIVSCCDDE